MNSLRLQWVRGLGFEGLGFEGLGFRVWGLGMVHDLAIRLADFFKNRFSLQR